MKNRIKDILREETSDMLVNLVIDQFIDNVHVDNHGDIRLDTEFSEHWFSLASENEHREVVDLVKGYLDQIKDDYDLSREQYTLIKDILVYDKLFMKGQSPRPGGRVELISMEDPYTNLKPGDQGTVTSYDGMGQIHVNWDTGSTLALIPGEDEFKKVD